jgi:DNA-binding XRE family transcriptional regulator
MNDLELLDACVKRSLPSVRTELLRPLRPDGVWGLDVRSDDYFIAVDWRETVGFMLTSDAEHGYGEGADEVYREFPVALSRVLHLIENKLETVPPHPIRIKELRESLGQSQTDVACRMGVQQAAVSKLESREDSHLGTLFNYVEALGGRLVLKAVFPDREHEIHLTNPG